jgi:aspartate/methionine/tyrosine aminotransferase
VSWCPPPGGIFAFARIRGCADSTTLSHELLERAHVVTIPGAVFGASGEGHLRMSYGYASAPELHEAVDRVQQFFAARA